MKNVRGIFVTAGLLAMVLSLGFGGASFAQQACPMTKGSADLKEGGGVGQKSQYWINGFPGKNPACQYTLEICYQGSGGEIGAKSFITTAEGAKLQSADNIVNCSKGYSRLFEGAVAGAQQIMVAVDSGVALNVRFVSKSLYGKSN